MYEFYQIEQIGNVSEIVWGGEYGLEMIEDAKRISELENLNNS
jgi:hypothetical protein